MNEKDQFVLLTRIIDHKKQEISNEKSNIERLEKEVKILNEIITEYYEPRKCKHCNGQGIVSVSYAQDEVRNELCSICKGMGIIEKK